MVQRRDRVEVYEDSAGEWRWRRRDPNGNIVSDSAEGYSRKPDALRAAHDVNVDVLEFEIVEGTT